MGAHSSDVERNQNTEPIPAMSSERGRLLWCGLLVLTAGIAALCFFFDICRGKFVYVSVVDRIQEFNRSFCYVGHRDERTFLSRSVKRVKLEKM